MNDVSFSILGTFELRAGDRQITIGAARVRALLAVLVLNAGEVVSADRLIDELWGQDPPASASHALQVYVSEARKALGTARDVLQTAAPGYVLRLGRDAVDVQLFERRTDAARAALAAGDAAAAADHFDEAFALWRGEPLSDFAYEPFAQLAIQRLEELRLSAEEDRIAADLLLGRHREAMPRLHELVRLHPLRERLHEHLIVALYRSGRQAEALQAYQDAREVLVEQLGIDPSRSLQELEKRVLNQDPSLDRPEGRPVEPASLATPDRSILVVAVGQAAPGVVTLAERLAESPVRHALINAMLLDPADGDAPAALHAATRSLAAWRSDMAERGITARATAFTSGDPADDVLRLASQQDVDLVLLESRAVVDEAGGVKMASILEDCAADVAIMWPRDPGERGPVLVPFAGREHDWAALELAAWVATAFGVPLRLLGAEAEDTTRDASRLLSHAALAVQQLSTVWTEHVLVPRGTAAILSATEEATALVLSCTDSWRQEGVGRSRMELATRAAIPVILVRRGLRPGGLAPNAALTRFTWSLSRR